ncbi:unnamed protein product [Arctogadus glacialis]
MFGTGFRTSSTLMKSRQSLPRGQDSAPSKGRLYSVLMVRDFRIYTWGCWPCVWVHLLKKNINNVQDHGCFR